MKKGSYKAEILFSVKSFAIQVWLSPLLRDFRFAGMSVTMLRLATRFELNDQ
jgi:hypothetical protein